MDELIAKIQDKNLRRKIDNILHKKIVKFIRCSSKICNGRIVAELDYENKITPTIDQTGKMWLLAYRQRLDGFWGFQCACGNDSRLAAQEKGVKAIEENHVDKVALEDVAAKLKKTPANYLKHGKEMKIDNFILEDIN